MDIGNHYWTAYFNPKTLYAQVLSATWRDDRVDNKREREGRIFQSKNLAEDWVEQQVNKN